MAGLFTKAYWNTFVLREIWARRNIETAPLHKTLAVQNRRVRRLVRHAFESVPFYRNAMQERGLRPRDIQSAADLSKLPVIRNEDVAADPDAFVSTSVDLSSCVALKTTGTTGRRKTIWHTPESLFLAFTGNARRTRLLCSFLDRNVGFQEISFRIPDSSATILRRFYEENSWVPPSLDRKRKVIDISLDWEEQVEAINTYQPDLVLGYGDHLGVLFRRIWASGTSIHRPSLVAYGASNMAPDNRRIIEEELKIPVLSSYQATEALHIAVQCPARKGLHIQLDQVAVHTVDENDRPVAEGKPGFLLISNLVNRATVLLNYRLGDVGALSDEPCPCGRTLPVIRRLDGRSNGILIAPDGRILGDLLESLPRMREVRQTQIVQEEPSLFRIRLVVAPEADRDQIRNLYDQAARDYIGCEVSLHIEFVDRIPKTAGGKTESTLRLLDSDPALSIGNSLDAESGMS